MKKTFSTRTAAILAAVTLSSLPVFAASTTTTAAKPQAVATVSKTLTVPAITVSRYGAKTKGAFTITWTDTSNGAYTYTLYRSASDKSGKLSGDFEAVTAEKDAKNKYTATDTVDAGKYYKYKLSVSDGKLTKAGNVSRNEYSINVVAKAKKAGAVKVSAKKTAAAKTETGSTTAAATTTTTTTVPASDTTSK